VSQSIKAIRGAITVKDNTEASVLDATEHLMKSIAEANGIGPDDIVAVWVTATTDITAAFPAKVFPSMGWGSVARMCAQELEIEGALPMCVRVMVIANVPGDVEHIYLSGAKILKS